MKVKWIRIVVIFGIFLVIAAPVFCGGGKEEKPKGIAVYLPGLLGAGNSMLELSKAGAEKAEAEANVNLKLIEIHLHSSQSLFSQNTL